MGGYQKNLKCWGVSILRDSVGLLSDNPKPQNPSQNLHFGFNDRFMVDGLGCLFWVSVLKEYIGILIMGYRDKKRFGTKQKQTVSPFRVSGLRCSESIGPKRFMA